MQNRFKVSDSIKIPLLSGICLLILVAVLKHVLKVPAETLSRDILIYILIYNVFGIFPLSNTSDKLKSTYWYLAIIIATIGIIVVYAL